MPDTPSRRTFVKSLAAGIQSATGGSVGREAAIVQIGAAFASRLSRITHIVQWQRMTLVAAGLGSRAPAEAARSAVAWGRSLVDGSAVAPRPVVLAAAVLLAYFWGTVLYVKTMIRERGRADVLAWSIGYHVVIAAAGSVVHPLLGAVGVLLAGRAGAVPRRWPRATPKAIGIGEIVATLVVAGTALAVL